MHIDRLSTGGRGVARHEGLVIFVADTAPDEDVEIELTLVKKNFAVARLLRIVKASPTRVKPPCPVAGICGGCSWQHVAYAEQLVQKRAIVHESLKKFAGAQVEVARVLPSPSEFRYRNRIQLHHAPAGRGPTPTVARARLGFFKRQSHEIVAIDDCPITETTLCAEFPRLQLELATTPAGRIEIFVNQDGRAERTRATEMHDDEVDAPVGTAFSQVNTLQNERLIDYVVTLAKAVARGAVSGARPERVDILELYAGGGNFTFPLAREFPDARIRAIELNSTSVARGKATVAREFGARSPEAAVEFEAEDVGRWLARHAELRPTFILLDPPRIGCGPDVVAPLAKLRAPFIAYVSCHPVTLARDLQTLLGSGYELTSVQPFDMFPQTDHVETVAFLRLRQD